MAITSGPLTSSPGAAPAPGTQNPLTLQYIQTPNVNPASLQMNPQGVVGTLAQGAPQSLTSLLMPLYSQLFGAQSGALAQNAALQGQQGVAQAQSSAQQRGLTGSSIEAGAMQGAQANAQNAYTQAYSSLLGQYVGQYAGAAGQDISNQQTYYGNLAQALGQGYSQQIQQQDFAQQLADSGHWAGVNSKNTLNAGLIQAAPGAVTALASLFSDMRLKKNVRKLGHRFGLDVVGFEYDHARAPHLSLPRGAFVGFLAHQVADKYPEAVSVDRGYLKVNYKTLAEAIHA